MKKLFYGLGAAAAIVTPVVAVVSCGSNENGKRTYSLSEFMKANPDRYDDSSDIIAWSEVSSAVNGALSSNGIKYFWFQHRDGRVGNAKLDAGGWIIGGDMNAGVPLDQYSWAIKTQNERDAKPKASIELIIENGQGQIHVSFPK